MMRDGTGWERGSGDAVLAGVLRVCPVFSKSLTEPARSVFRAVQEFSTRARESGVCRCRCPAWMDDRVALKDTAKSLSSCVFRLCHLKQSDSRTTCHLPCLELLPVQGSKHPPKTRVQGSGEAEGRARDSEVKTRLQTVEQHPTFLEQGP